MHVPRFVLLKSSSWWSRPNVCPTSWHDTRFRHAVVLYVAVLKYVSFSFTVPCVMWIPPVIQIDAMPSQPLLLDVVARIESHCEDTLSPSLTVNGFAVRAQW